jgi:hypothetical protein
MRREVIPDHLAVLHHEANALELGNLGERIAPNSNEITKFPRLKQHIPLLVT